MKHRTRWDLPKGHLDPGETKQQAALRELHEETGLKPLDVWLDPSFVFENVYSVAYKRNGGKKQLKELTIYLAFLLADKQIFLSEHEGFEWIEWMPPHRIQIETIDTLLNQVEKHFAMNPDWPKEL